MDGASWRVYNEYKERGPLFRDLHVLRKERQTPPNSLLSVSSLWGGGQGNRENLFDKHTRNRYICLSVVTVVDIIELYKLVGQRVDCFGASGKKLPFWHFLKSLELIDPQLLFFFFPTGVSGKNKNQTCNICIVATDDLLLLSTRIEKYKNKCMNRNAHQVLKKSLSNVLPTTRSESKDMSFQMI